MFSDPHKTHKYTGRTELRIIYKDPVRTAQCTQSVPSYTNQSVNAVQGNNRCLFSDLYKTHKYTVRAERSRICSYVQPAVPRELKILLEPTPALIAISNVSCLPQRKKQGNKDLLSQSQLPRISNTGAGSEARDRKKKKRVASSRSHVSRLDAQRQK